MSARVYEDREMGGCLVQFDDWLDFPEAMRLAGEHCVTWHIYQPETFTLRPLPNRRPDGMKGYLGIRG